MKKLLALLALLAGCLTPAFAQMADSTVCTKCVLAKVDTVPVLMKIDTVAVVVRFDSVYAIKYDSTYRDSTVKVPVPQPPNHQPAVTALVGTNTCSAVTDGGWLNYLGGSRLSVVNDPERGMVCEANYAGLKPGTGPVGLSRLTPPGTHLYISLWLKVSAGFVGHQSNVNKVFHIWYGGVDRVVFKLYGAGQQPLKWRGSLQNVVGGSRELPMIGNPTVSRGVWHFLELEIVPNSVMRWWLDGQLVGDVQTTWVASPVPVTKIQWNPTWGGVGGANAPAQTMLVDDMSVRVGP